MSLAIILSRASVGINAPQVTIEVHLSNGLPKFTIVGLPETAVKESKDRVRSAIINSRFDFPSRRITVNLAPADLPKKDGGRFDLAIALGILCASEQLPKHDLNLYEFAGELALDGSLRTFSGALPFALGTRNAKRKLILPKANAKEAALPENISLLPANHLLEVAAHLANKKELPPYEDENVKKNPAYDIDISDILGQEHAKRALEIAAAGRHSLLMFGPPGTGKTMLASRLPTILPNMNEDEALDTAIVHSLAGKTFDFQNWCIRPFQAPHHTASSCALVGGSNPPKPGEISLAHNGVLFLDELPEFNRSVLEALREPLESKYVTISRAAYQAKFPADFQLIAAMNPCPCGHFGNSKGNCRCTSEQIRRYQNRISAPFLDRIDMHIEVPSLAKDFLKYKNGKNTAGKNRESSAMLREKIETARKKQYQRSAKLNANLSNIEIEKFCALDDENNNFLNNAIDKMNLSLRAYHRILKITRTIADLENADNITKQHLSEALHYRKINLQSSNL